MLVATPVLILQFLTVTFVDGVTTEMPVGAVVFELVMVRFRDDDPLFDPSIVTKVAPLILINAPLATLPEMVALTPLAGLMVTVLTALEPGIAPRVSGKVSLGYEASVNSSVVARLMPS